MDLRRTQSIKDSRTPSKISHPASLRYRQKLDSSWEFLSNPYSAWRAKRLSVEDELSKLNPDYTQDELNKIYTAIGLDSSTNPGDFNREDSITGSLSRAGSKAANSFGDLFDTAQMKWADWNDDIDGVMSEQQQIDDSRLETGLIDSFQKQSSYGQNVISQFLFDLASSAPIMGGIMVTGIATGGLATVLGAPAWLAGLLGMGAADALSEMGFNYADVVSNPMVRKKMEKALGKELNDADMEEIRIEVQKRLMDAADSSAAQVGIANFINPLNWVPAVNKLSKLMKIGSGRMGSIGRTAISTAAREGVEEFGQSIGSQYTAKEAQMKAMRGAGVTDMPSLSVDPFQAGYEALMGIVVGGGFGSIGGSRGYSNYLKGNINVDSGGHPIYKKPNEEGFVGQGPLRFDTRRMVDSGDPKLLDQWVEAMPRRDNEEGDAREGDIILDELDRIRSGEDLLGEKTSPEKKAQRQENVKEFDEYKQNPEAYLEARKSPEQRQAEEAQVRSELEGSLQAVQVIEDQAADAEAQLAEAEANAPESVVVRTKFSSGNEGVEEATVHRTNAGKVRMILSQPAQKRNARTKKFLELAIANPEMEFKELDKKIKEEEKFEKEYLINQEAKPKKGAVEVGDNTQGGSDAMTALLNQLGGEIAELKDGTKGVEQRMNAIDPTVTPTPATLTPTPVVEDAPIQQTTTLKPEDLKLGPAADEIINTLKSWVGQDKKAKSWDGLKGTGYSTWEKVRGKLYTPLKEVGRPLNDETTRIQGGPKKGGARTEYFISPSIRLAKLNELAAQLGITPPQIGTTTEVINDNQPTITTYEGSDTTDVVTETTPAKAEYAKNFDENAKPIDFKHPVEELELFINKEVYVVQGKVASWNYENKLTEYTAVHKGGEARGRDDKTIKQGVSLSGTTLRFMGLNADGAPYFYKVGERADRTGSTARDIDLNQKEITNAGAVAHLLSGAQKSFSNIKEVGKGKKKKKEAQRSYTTITELEQVPESDQAKLIKALHDDIVSYELEFDQLEETINKKRAAADLVLVDTQFVRSLRLMPGEGKFLKMKAHRDAVGADPKDVKRLEELAELIGESHAEIESLKLGTTTPLVTVAEGGGKKPNEPLNALGRNQKDINARKKNLRKLLKQPNNKDSLSNEDTERILSDIEEVFGDERLEMDRSYGIELGEITESTNVKTKEGKNKQVSSTKVSLMMSKNTPIDTRLLSYALNRNGWRLVDPDIDGLVENEFEVVVGDSVTVKGVPKYQADAGTKTEKAAKVAAMRRDAELDDALKTRKGEGYKKVGLTQMEGAKIQDQADEVVRDLDLEAYEETLPGVSWKEAARQWFKTADAPKKPPRSDKTKSGWSTDQAVEMVRQQMKADPNVNDKTVDTTTDDQILEFLWSGPGGGFPKPAGFAKYNPSDASHQGVNNVDVTLKNEQEPIVVVARWGTSIRGYKKLAKEINESNAKKIDLIPEGKKNREETLRDASKKRNAKKPEVKEATPSSDKLSPAEIKAWQNKTLKDIDKRQAKIDKEELETTTEEAPPPAETTAENTLGLINIEEGGELQNSMPPADKKKHDSARFNALKVLSRYQDVSKWDSRDNKQTVGEESKTLTVAIRNDIEEAGQSSVNIKDVVALIRRKLRDYLVLEIQTSEDVEGLREKIDKQYYDLLVTPGQKAINKELEAKGSTEIKRERKTPASKKKSKSDPAPLKKEGFIIDNVVSATVTGIPTKKPKLNDVWLIAPEETEQEFSQRSEGKDMEELTNFLDSINNEDFFVVKKTGKWSDAYILMRDEHGAPTKGRGFNKIKVPAAIRKRLSREGKFFNAQRPDFPTDREGKITQRSRKLVREELTNLKGTISSNLFTQLFRSQAVDLNVLQEALDEGRIKHVHNPGLDNTAQVLWLNKDNKVETDGIDNVAMVEFKDRSSLDSFVAEVRNKNPKEFDSIDREWRLASEKQTIESQVSEEFVDNSEGGIGSIEDGTYESSEIPLIGESLDTVTEEVAEDVYGGAYDPEVAAQIALDNKAKANPEVRINSRGMGGVELLFKNPIPITSGSEQYSSEGVLWMGDAMNVGVTNKNNEEIGFKVTTDRNRRGLQGTLGINVINIEGPKSPKAPLPNMNQASIDAQWTKVFGAEKVAAIKNISFTEPKSNVYKTHPNISEALDKALDILLPGTRGYVNVSHVMQTDTGITLGAGKPIVQQLSIRSGKPWSDEVIEEAQARVDAVYNPQEGGESLESKIARREQQQLKALANKKGTSKRLAEDPPEGAEPVSFKVISDIVDRFREAFPGLADVTIIKDQTPGFKAIYDKKFDRIYLVNKQHFSEEDVIKSLWHEGIGHGGLQAIMTEEEYLNLKQRAEVSFPERFQEELELINKDKDFNTKSDEEKRSLAAQEVLAHYADNLDGQSESIIDTITSWIREIYNGFATVLGFNELTLTEGDMRSLLLETADALRYHNKERRLKVLPKVDSMSDLPEQVDTSLQRRAVRPNPTAFSNTNLPESARASWEKLYARETKGTSGSWWKDIRQRLLAKIFDPFSIIKDEIGVTQYMQSRLAGRSDGMLATLLRHSGIKVEKRSVNGVVINETVIDPKIRGFFTMLKPLGNASERQQFFGWMAFSRAWKLYNEGKETGFTKDEILEGLEWDQGRIKDASTGVVVSRSVLYDKIRKEVMGMNSAVVKMGADLGLFDSKVTETFESEFYVPLYRLMEEEIGSNDRGSFTGNYSSLTGQQGVKKLKGSNRPIGDPFNNLLFNWLHIMDASIKNDAANTTISSALSIRNPMDSSQMLVEPANFAYQKQKSGKSKKTVLTQPNTVRVKQNGKDVLYNINNQLLYDSMTALSSETKFPGLKYAIGAKSLYTKIVTSFPGFKIGNVLKDTLTAAGTSDIGFNLIKNAYGGYKDISKYEAQMLVSGGYIQFAYTRSDDPKYAENLLNKELTSGYILNNPESDDAFISSLKKANHMRKGVLERYYKWGDKLENANRAALFKKLLQEGKSQTEAAYEARDLMDFTLHGGSDWVKLVTSLTPFANAILQGKYKIGRQIISNPKPVAIVAGLVTLASIFEEMLYEDDEEYQRRPDWDKDTYWWIKIPGTDTVFKMPKPHEFSIAGNMAWRALKLAKGENPKYGEALMSGVRSIVSREFGIVPIPQVVRPFLELGMNKNIFFDRDIEPMGTKGLSPSNRYGQFTSETLILASRILEGSPIDKLKLSPYQLEHLINGYFGWIGSYALATADMVTRSTGDFPERPARKLMDYHLARRFFKSSPLRNTKSGTIFYERLKDIEQTVQDMNLSRKLDHMDTYNEIYDEKKDLLKYKAFINKKARMVNDINARIKQIRFHMKMGGDEKAVRLDRLYQLRNQLLDNIANSSAFR